MQIYRHLTANHIVLKAMPFFREISMEAYLIENPDVLALDEEDLSTVSIVDAEVPVPEARRTKNADGRIDLLAVYGESTVGIVELKLGQLNEGHLTQLEDYLARADQLRDLLKEHAIKEDTQLIGVLVGTSIGAELRAKIEIGYVTQEAIPIAALTLSRYKGNDNNVYVVTDTFFKNSSRKFDKTKYRLNGETHGKNRLVLSIIKRYVEDHPGLTFSALSKIFPKELQGWSGCFETVENAEKTVEETGYRRHFLKAEEIIELADSRIAVSTQWGIKKMGRFIETAQNLGFKIAEV
jgi:hypothetical protein